MQSSFNKTFSVLDLFNSSRNTFKKDVVVLLGDMIGNASWLLVTLSAGGYRSLGGPGPVSCGAVRGGAAGRPRGLSPPGGRVRAVVASAGVRRSGVSSRAPGGGGEPRAARPRPPHTHRAHARPHPRPRRPNSAPPRPRRAHPRARRLRSLPRAPTPAGPVPRLRPVFLWARQRDGTVQEVRCEDYDPRNRIRIARTSTGWRVIPRTDIYNSIRLPPPPPPPPRSRRKRYSKSRRRSSPEPAWHTPDLETHIPSHKIAVPRAPPEPPPPPPPPPLPPPPPPPAEPTPLDNLLAVAELEFHQQRGSELLELDGGSTYGFLEPARDAMPFEPGEQKGSETYAGLGAHAELFDTISEAHYLPELGGHDEALLESLVEKGCEDNQILDQTLDKLAHLVHGADYAEEEDDMLLSGAPVADIIDRLEQSLESPGRSSISAAHGLLHLHRLADHLPPAEHAQPDQTYEVYPPVPEECALQALNSQNSEANHMEYNPNAEKTLENINDTLYTHPVPDPHETYETKVFEEVPPPLPDQSEAPIPNEAPSDVDISEICVKRDTDSDDSQAKLDDTLVPVATVDFRELDDNSACELVATDLSLKPSKPAEIVSVPETTTANLPIEDNLSDKSDELPRDLSVPRRLPTPHASPRRTEMPRAPSRESDAMQSPQPSGIPAVPSSPEIFTMPPTKSKQTMFLESLLSSPSPKMYTSEVTISKQQPEPLNLGKHRKSASPTVTSCSDEMRKSNKDFGEPQEKRIKHESTEDLAKISKVFGKSNDDQVSESRSKKADRSAHKSGEENSPLKQLQVLKTSPDFNIPDPLLVPKDKLNHILSAPGREIPALLIQRPELRLPEAFAFPAILQDPDILVISLSQLENILQNDAKKESSKPKENRTASTRTSSSEQTSSSQADQSSQPRPIPSMDALAGDIDAATSAALNQMLWLPYLSQLEAMANCSQNMDFLKALNSSGYNGPNYPDLSQMFNPSARFMGQPGFPMMPQMDYENRLQFAMWQEAMNHANATASQRNKPSADAQMKELPSKSTDVQNPYVHSTNKNHQSKPHSSARTSPITPNYNSNQRMGPNPFLQGMYPGMNPNMRPNMPLPGLQIPYFNPNMMGNRGSPRAGQQKSPTSPYFPNNNYLQSAKHSEQSHQRSSSTSSQESPRPRISVKSLQNLLEPTAGGSPGPRRPANPPTATARRREETEVGSTTPLGEPPPHPMPHPHDPSSFHLWHPLFGNQKSYASPWSWTTVTATGD